MFDFYILEWSGGEYEDTFEGSTVYVSREKAEAAFEKYVAEARVEDGYFSTDYIDLYKATLDEESGAILRDSGNRGAIKSWFRYADTDCEET